MISKLNYIFSKKDKIEVIGLLFMIITGSFLELLGVTIFMPFIEIIMEPAAIRENVYLNWLYEYLSFQSVGAYLTFIAFIIIGVYIVKNVFLAVMRKWILMFSYNKQMTTSTRLLSVYVNEDYTFHLNQNSAVLIRSTQEDPVIFTDLLIHTLELLAEVTVCIVIGIYLFDVSQSIAGVVVLILLVCVGGFGYISKKYSKKLGQNCQIYKANLYQWINQALGGIKEIKVLHREKYFTDIYEENYVKFAKDKATNRLMADLPKYIVEATCMCGLLLAIIIKINFGQKELIDFIPQLSVFAVAAFRLLPSVGKINNHITNIIYSIPSLELIYHDLKLIEDFEDKEEAIEDSEWKFTDKIEVSKVVYKYPGAEAAVLENAGFVIPKGKTVALIGSSGAGKTTMADIILGLLKPQYGKIKADGMDIYKHLSLWRKQLGYIPQTIYLSDDTIRNNIAFGIREEEIDDYAVMEALKKAQLSDFVDGLPDGIETLVGDRGVRLSGGQRQRIGIARALYHDPEILVLDEATSALDNETETAVMESVESLHGTKTMIIIAHRLTTIRNADIIYEVAEGKVNIKNKEEIFTES